MLLLVLILQIPYFPLDVLKFDLLFLPSFLSLSLSLSLLCLFSVSVSVFSLSVSLRSLCLFSLPLSTLSLCSFLFILMFSFIQPGPQLNLQENLQDFYITIECSVILSIV